MPSPAAFRPRSPLGVFAAMLALCFSLAACNKPEVNYAEGSVDVLYNDALSSLKEQDYNIAAAKFSEVERQHPYSEWARRAILMSAYSSYMANKYSDAILSAERFIALHPGNRDVAYAYYLKSICYYEQIADVGRDQKMTEDALASLDEVVRRFPATVYARDARLKLDLTRDHLAGKEMAVGRYYLRRHEYLAALNRFRTVVTDYQTTSHVPEALHRLTETYLAMGVKGEAQTSAAVLGYNFPGSEWYQDSYALLTSEHLQPVENKRSWISRAWHTVL
jgi:outer membrane protein assembly factor BamD